MSIFWEHIASWYTKQMKPIAQIYEEYQIMPNLQVHQLRVAAVAQQICDSATVNLDKHSVITACLMHDIANIIKFELKRFPEFLEPQGLEYWQSVQKAFIDTYGADEHRAALKIAADMKMPQVIVNLIRSIGFGEIPEVVKRGSVEEKICCYSDQRVGPFGVITIEERLVEGKARYAHRTDRKLSINFDAMANDLRTLEQQVFDYCTILSTDITNDSIQPEIELLKKYEV